MKVPQCLLHILIDDRARIFPESIPTESNTSVVDCISHTLLSALAGTQQGREWGKQASLQIILIVNLFLAKLETSNFIYHWNHDAGFQV
jgi:hypothetical protein